MSRSLKKYSVLREKVARENVFHFPGAIGKTVGLSYKAEASL